MVLLDQKYRFFGKHLLGRLEGYSLLPFADNILDEELLGDLGGTPPPNYKIHQAVFDRLP